MISKEAWMNIGRGDVIVTPSGPRTVQMGPRDMADTTQQDHVTFARRNPSEYSRRGNGATHSTVCYDFTQLKERGFLLKEVPTSAIKLLLETEAARLKELGINWRKAIKHETTTAIRRVEQGLYNVSICHVRRAEGKANLA